MTELEERVANSVNNFDGLTWSTEINSRPPRKPMDKYLLIGFSSGIGISALTSFILDTGYKGFLGGVMGCVIVSSIIAYFQQRNYDKISSGSI